MKVYRDPLQKCNNPGGDCYWEGGQPKIDLFTLQYHFPLLPWIYSVVTYIHQWSSIHVSRSTCGNVSLWMIKYVMVGHFCYIFKLTTDPTSQQFRLSEQVSFSGLAKQTGDVNLPDWFCPSKRFSASMQQPFFSTYGFLAMNKPTSSGNVSTNDWITVYQLAASKKSSLNSKINAYNVWHHQSLDLLLRLSCRFFHLEDSESTANGFLFIWVRIKTKETKHNFHKSEWTSKNIWSHNLDKSCSFWSWWRFLGQKIHILPTWTNLKLVWNFLFQQSF